MIVIEQHPLNRAFMAILFGLAFTLLTVWGLIFRANHAAAILGTLSQIVAVIVTTAGGMYVFRSLMTHAKTHPAPNPRYYMIAGGVIALVLAWLVVVASFVFPAQAVRALINHGPYQFGDAIRSWLFATSMAMNLGQLLFIISLKDKDVKTAEHDTQDAKDETKAVIIRFNKRVG
jgi:uncharacterized membrane protein